MDFIDEEGFRANVGIILTDGGGQVLIAGRRGRTGWQFPQGGVRHDESVEAAMYRDKHVFVIGGGNSAGQGAMFFSRYARQVTVVVRPPKLDTMSQYLIDRISETSNVDVLVGTVVSSVSGSGRLEHIALTDGETNAAL